MSTDETPEPETVDEPGEQGGMSERTAKLIIAAVALAALAAIVIVFPYVAYFVAGILACRGWQKTSGWIGRRGSSDAKPGPDAGEVTAEEIVETLHEVANPNVFLADFAAAFDLDTAAARALLEGQEIRVRRAVRNGDSTGVGVHKDDLPPLPRSVQETPVGGVDQGQPTNQQGLSAEPIGLAGVVVKDGSETSRRHQVRN
ncbi:hypothetical protein [Streptomyces sp. AK02-04a]|uniref:hypothetical protein n=1 Tax=Streptomyces sp. AK02-04a TaxID=3028649 RepID=UPI0029A3C114|nr:hypothetical protein [Streptomyces sp. AK02-04a]MDX3759322.1 hypothetical protein [Streptomyces sp. AK02-04a]